MFFRDKIGFAIKNRKAKTSQITLWEIGKFEIE